MGTIVSFLSWATTEAMPSDLLSLCLSYACSSRSSGLRLQAREGRIERGEAAGRLVPCRAVHGDPVPWVVFLFPPTAGMQEVSQ